MIYAQRDVFEPEVLNQESKIATSRLDTAIMDNAARAGSSLLGNSGRQYIKIAYRQGAIRIAMTGTSITQEALFC